MPNMFKNSKPPVLNSETVRTKQTEAKTKTSPETISAVEEEDTSVSPTNNKNTSKTDTAKGAPEIETSKALESVPQPSMIQDAPKPLIPEVAETPTKFEEPSNELINNQENNYSPAITSFIRDVADNIKVVEGKGHTYSVYLNGRYNRIVTEIAKASGASPNKLVQEIVTRFLDEKM